MGNEKKTKKRPNKIVALVTYIIALICLLLGLFLPTDFANATASMLGLQIPAAIGVLISGVNIQGSLPDFAYSFPFKVFGFPAEGIDLAAVLVLLYALVVVAGIVALIPVFVSALGGKGKKGKNAEAEAETAEPQKGKKDKNVALRAASFIEVLAMIVLSTFVFLYLNQLKAISEFTNYGILAAFGGTLLMLIVQAFFYKGSSGVMKFILTIFSALAVICLYGVSFMLPFLADIVANFNLTLYTMNGATADALTLINSMFTTGLNLQQDIAIVILEITSVVLGYLICVNFVIDVMGLGKKTNKFMLISNIVRYGLELAALIVILVTVLVKQATLGNLAIVFAVIAALSLIFNIIRLAAYSAKQGKKAKKGAKAKKEQPAEKPAKTRPEEGKKKPAPVVAAEAAPEAKKEEPDQKLYSPVIYNGPTDDFIRTLTNDQKVEFSKVFLERQQGPISCIPDYSVGGRNDKFFASIFIYYARVRDLVSDELMNSFYKQANVM